MHIVGWKAWYTQNRVFSSDETDWRDLPKTGVLAVLVFFDERSSSGAYYKELLHGKRRYFRADGTAQEFIKGSLWNEKKLLDTYETTKEDIKEGIWDDDATVKKVLAEATAAVTWQTSLHTLQA